MSKWDSQHWFILRAQSEEELHNFLMLIPQVTQSLKTHFLGYLSDHIVFGLAGFSFLLSSRFIPSILLEIQSVALLIIKLILSLEFKRVRVSFRIKIYSFFFTPIFFLLSFLAGLSLWFQLLDQHGRLQSSLRENWVWPSWNQTTDLLEHTLLQDLSGDEDRPADRPHCHQQTDQLLYSLIADGHYRSPSQGQNTWKSLIGSHLSLRTNCNKGCLTLCWQPWWLPA